MDNTEYSQQKKRLVMYENLHKNLHTFQDAIDKLNNNISGNYSEVKRICGMRFYRANDEDLCFGDLGLTDVVIQSILMPILLEKKEKILKQLTEI